MVFDIQRMSRLPLAVWSALFFGLVVGILIVAAPAWQLERAVSALGLDEITSAAQPPLGHKARLLIAVLASGLVSLAILVPYGIFRLARPRRAIRPVAANPLGMPKRQKADVNTRASTASQARRPIFADQELGAPLMSAGALARPSVFESGEIASTIFNSDTAESHASQPQPQPGAPYFTPPDATALSNTDDAVAVGAERGVDRSVSVQPIVSDLPAVVATLDEDKPTVRPLSEMIARLERGLTNRMPPLPPSPPAATAGPLNGRVETMPIAAPLSVVPRTEHSADFDRDDADNSLSQAMRKLSGLVSNQR